MIVEFLLDYGLFLVKIVIVVVVFVVLLVIVKFVGGKNSVIKGELEVVNLIDCYKDIVE